MFRKTASMIIVCFMFFSGIAWAGASSASLEFTTNSQDNEYSVGEYMDIGLKADFGLADTISDDTYYRRDLYIYIALPSANGFFLTDELGGSVSMTPKPFKRGLSRYNNNIRVLSLTVTPELIGNYKIFAFLTSEDANLSGGITGLLNVLRSPVQNLFFSCNDPSSFWGRSNNPSEPADDSTESDDSM